MANITRSATASFDGSTGAVGGQLSGLLCGEDIPSAIMPCQIKADGKIWRASGAAADSNAKVRGFSTKSAKAGQPLTLYRCEVRARYSDALLTPGTDLYLSATTGELSDTATTGGTAPIAFAATTSDIIIRGL